MALGCGNLVHWGMAERIPIGSDHAGVELKERLIEELEALGYQPVDVGTSGTQSVDYPDFAHQVATQVEHGEAGRGGSQWRVRRVCRSAEARAAPRRWPGLPLN